MKNIPIQINLLYLQSKGYDVVANPDKMKLRISKFCCLDLYKQERHLERHEFNLMAFFVFMLNAINWSHQSEKK